MLPDLAALVALQQLDTAAEAARRRLAELPGAEAAILGQVASAQAAVDEAKSRVTANAHDRRELEKQVAAVDARLSKFDSHKAAVKTNHEYTALLHEIATAKTEKDAIEEQILVLMDAGDGIAAEVKAAEAALSAVKKQGDVTRAALAVERTTLEREITRLSGEKAAAAAGVSAATLARYEQLLKQRRLIAVAAIAGEMCTACHVRLRPAVTQRVRRNVEIITCDSCQRILYFPETPATAATDVSAASQEQSQ
jgi:predicted  nucleic acid-binding Zn-ribbon protein